MNAQSELYYIQRQAGQPISYPSSDDFVAYGEKYGFPLQASEDVLGLSYSYGRHFAEQGNAEAARYFLSIFYNLTRDEEVKEIIDSLPENEE